MPLNAKQKGSRFERAVVTAAQAFGLDARRMAPMQSDPRAEEPDVMVAGRKVECKHRESLNQLLWDWLQGNEILMLKRNNKEPLAVLRMVDLFVLLGGKPGGEGQG